MSRPEHAREGTAPAVAVVTLNYDGGDLTLRCIEALRETEWPADRRSILLVDNASRDGVAMQVRTRWPDVQVIESTENRGYAGGMNLGLAAVRDFDYVALLNNDVIVPSDWLAPLVAALEADEGLGAACPKIRFASRYLTLELEVPTTTRGRGDARALGALVSGARVDGADVTPSIQYLHGFWGQEPGSEDTPSPGQWTRERATLRLPVALDADAPGEVELRLSSDGLRDAVVTSGAARTTVALTTAPSWCSVTIDEAPEEVINNAGSVVDADGYGADRGYLEPDNGRLDEPTEVFAWCGAAVVLARRYLDDVGPFDERLFLYYEDLELSWRGRERGWRYRYVPSSVVRHVHSATVGEQSSLARYQNERNHLLVLARHGRAGALARATWRAALVTASYARRDIAAPLLRGEAPRPAIVRDRTRALGGFVRLLPAMVRERSGATAAPTRDASG